MRYEVTLTPPLLLLFNCAVKGDDPAEADDNLDGRPRDNSFIKNEIYSENDLVWRMKEADSSVFKV